ncbi:MAG: EF-P beta-lysylation protein EpmB, partial [Planctomycetota bacterium]
RLRIHSRMPIAIPQRTTSQLIEILQRSRLAVWLVIHSNHVAELDDLVWRNLDSWLDAGIPVLNQAVLLAGVNDNVDALEALCRECVDHRVMPYYLHQLDRVQGASHFEVPVDRGMSMVDELRLRLPGYAVPQYVVEQAGEASKTPIQ